MGKVGKIFGTLTPNPTTDKVAFTLAISTAKLPIHGYDETTHSNSALSVFEFNITS
ncbi:hypothetical protein FD01_GL000888 [Lacticaseibacillus manihotivorans DSM 13343 = JCM 12514]|uniref:Uncharacterized protein n=1 Tax=Lacticaseibacillus manihotivorans DSM 13343 = JCM 12514 TaxID=1423769 RepID=A0A0R1QRU6_9LACO|nr:hypothetical protein FD01_GL000888 [Lacticaseibacillus manihotivorans DSM 13343 = JCM 12514]